MDLWKQVKLKKGNSIFLDQFYFQIGVKMHRGGRDCTTPCPSVVFRVFLQNSIMWSKEKWTHLYPPSPLAMVQLLKSLKDSSNSKEIFILTSFLFILTILNTITTIFIRRADEYIRSIKYLNIYHVNNVATSKTKFMVRHILQFRI